MQLEATIESYRHSERCICSRDSDCCWESSTAHRSANALIRILGIRLAVYLNLDFLKFSARTGRH